MKKDYNLMAMVMKALSDPNRLVIIDFLSNGERCACMILEQLKITQPTLSHHMRILCETDLVHCRRDGKWMHYSLNHDKFKELKDYLGSYSIMVDDGKVGNCC